MRGIARWSAHAVFAAMLLALAMPLDAAPDAGLNLAFQLPAPVTGATIDATSAPYNATPGNNADDDAVGINAAIAAASAGDEVYLPDGIYHVMSEMDLDSGVSLRGQSEAGTIIRSSYSTTGLKTLQVPSGSADVTISNLSFDSDGVEPPRYVIEIGLNSGPLTQRVHVHDVTVQTFSERGMIARVSRHVKFEDCTISDATELGGGGFGYGITIQESASDNNWVTGCTIGPVIRHGVLLQNSTHHNLIENNTFNFTTEDAIDLHGEDEYSNEVRYNDINDSARSAIGIGNTGTTHDKSGPNNWIHHNTARDCLDGIEIAEGTDDVFVENNDIQDCTNYGLRIENFVVVGDPFENISITDNIFSNCNRGISVEIEAPNLVVMNNTIVNNAVVGVQTDAAVTGYTITFNNISCNGTAAILGSATGTYANNDEMGTCVVPVELTSLLLE